MDLYFLRNAKVNHGKKRKIGTPTTIATTYINLTSYPTPPR